MKLFWRIFFVLFCVLSESHEKCVMVKTHAINIFFDVFAIYLRFQSKIVKTLFFRTKMESCYFRLRNGTYISVIVNI